MRQAVVAEVVPEGAFGEGAARVHPAGDGEVGIRRDHEAVVPPPPAEAPSGQHPGEEEFAKPLRERHHRGERVGRGASDEDADPERLLPPLGRRVVHSDAAMDLVVHPGLSVAVLAPGELDAVHPDVGRERGAEGASSGRNVGILGEHLGQGDERTPVVRPGGDSRNVREGNPVRLARRGANPPGQGMDRGRRGAERS